MPGPVGHGLEGDSLVGDPGQVLFLYDVWIFLEVSLDLSLQLISIVSSVILFINLLGIILMVFF